MKSREVDLHEPAWNQAELLERVDNDRELVLELLAIFKEDFPRTILSLEAAMSSGNLENSLKQKKTRQTLSLKIT